MKTAPKRNSGRQPRGPRRESGFIKQIIGCVRAGKTPWGRVAYVEEYEYGPGRTDILGFTDTEGLVAFEAKLHRWRDAVFQAYRNRAYVDISYIILPHAIAERAASFAHFFAQYGVGLCTIVESELRVLIPGQRETPIQHWQADKARATFQGRHAAAVNPT